jgi:hypothetical protein
VRRTLERIGLVVVTALVAVSATAYASRGSSQGGFINAQRGQWVRFVGTNVVCVEPKGQVSGGNVGCQVTYKYWRNILRPGPVKYDVGLTLLHCIDIGKWSRTFKLLKSKTVC